MKNQPYIIWRNRAVPDETRKANYDGITSEGKKYEVVERTTGSSWVVVAVLTVIDGGRKIAA